ncbi:MAG: polysialyltransferase family glycosyltransferase [Bacteroidota bacterium]
MSSPHHFHVFTVHSPITFLAAHAIVQQLQIPVEHVVILSDNYHVPIDKYRVYPYLDNLNRKWYQILRRLNTPLNEDHYLDKILGGRSFVAYIDLMSYHQAILVTHPKCLSFNFFEEGAFSYRTGDTMASLAWDWYFKKYPYRVSGFANRLKHIFLAMKWAARGYSQRLLAVPYSYNAYAFVEGVNYYGFSDQTFPDIPPAKKHVLQLSENSPDIDQLAAGIKLEQTFIWVDGARGKFTRVPDSYYHRAIDKAIDLFRSELQERGVYVKLRPGKKDLTNNYLYQTLCKQGFDVQVLPDELVLECVFINAKDCVVIGNVSPALLYAKAMGGHRAYTIYSLYEKREETELDHLPGFWSMVEAL